MMVGRGDGAGSSDTADFIPLKLAFLLVAFLPDTSHLAMQVVLTLQSEGHPVGYALEHRSLLWVQFVKGGDGLGAEAVEPPRFRKKVIRGQYGSVQSILHYGSWDGLVCDMIDVDMGRRAVV